MLHDSLPQRLDDFVKLLADLMYDSMMWSAPPVPCLQLILVCDVFLVKELEF